MMRSFTLLLVAVLAGPVLAQDGDLAYVPREAPARTADDASIVFLDTPEPGIVEVVLPRGTYQVDLLNASGSVVRKSDAETASTLDMHQLKAGTWTVRAHTPTGLRVRRFVVLGQGGTLWVNQRQAPRR